MEVSFNQLINKLKSYNPDEVEIVTKAYNFAKYLHDGQLRESGEEYITHPLSVAYILAEMHADRDTICAALLHDTLEDTKITKEEITEEFNQEITKLVSGVTKLAKMDFGSKEAQNLANTRKIITGLTDDVRIIIIKLADRLHNMRTLDFKKPEKQKENALETMEIFVPLAYYIGAYRIKNELEDLSFKYLMPLDYQKTEEQRLAIEEEYDSLLKAMAFKIKKILLSKDLPHEIKTRTKNIYGIYKSQIQGKDIANINDLFMLKIMVQEIEDCYNLLYPIHREFKPLNDMKDYICNPKINKYQSLHSTVFGPEGRLIQMQLRTFEMDRTASFGITAYWDTHKGDARYKMQQELKDKYQFCSDLSELDSMFTDNKEFVEQVKLEVFGDNIIVYTRKGERLSLPIGATPIDFAYKIAQNLGNTMSKVYVNDVEVPFDYALQNHDRVRIICASNEHGFLPEWSDIAVTSHARKFIKSDMR